VVSAEAQVILPFETGKGVKHDLRLGLEYRYKQVSWTYLDRERFEHHESAFLHDEVKIGDTGFGVAADYRLDYVPYLAEFVQSPRGTLLYHPSNQSTIRGSVATAFRTPTLLESYLSIPLQLPVTGAATLTEG